MKLLKTIAHKLKKISSSSSSKAPSFQILSKKYDSKKQEYIFTILSKENISFKLSIDELANDKKLLACMDFADIYDIGYTHGSTSILREKAALQKAKLDKKIELQKQRRKR